MFISRLFLKSVFGLLSFFVILAFAVNVSAMTFTVTKIADTNDGVCNSDCSLREAIGAANTAGSDDTIEFEKTVFSTARTITLSSGEIFVTNKGSLVINGTGATQLIITSNLQSRIFQITMPIDPQFTITINNLTISAGNSGGNTGGCIYKDSGVLNINNSVVKDCISSASGGGVYNSLGTLNISNSTISGNTSGMGGGIAGGGTNAILLMTNSTVSGNKATMQGGGIANQIGTTATLTNVTIAFNTANSGGGIYNFFNGTITNIRNSIIAKNNASGNAPDFEGTLTSEGYNLIGSTQGTSVTGTTTGNITGQDPKLGVLQDNGGTTPTHALLTGSSAIDTADPNNFSVIDQRGVPRPLDGDLTSSALPDIGAFEAGAKVVTKTVDTNDGVCDADCSLREAIAVTNNSVTNEAIIFSSLFRSVQTITLSSTELAIMANGKLTINGPGANLLTLSGNNSNRVFNINANATVIINDLTVANGNSSNFGGAIYSGGMLTLNNSIVSNSVATFGGGGIYNDRKTLTISNSGISNNSNGIYNNEGILTITGSTISSNIGGVANYRGTLTLTASIVNNNTARGGAGITNVEGNAILTEATVSNNSVTGYNSSGGGITNFSGGSSNPASMIINNSRITGNTAEDGSGGGISNVSASLSITNTTIDNNKTLNDEGAGLYIFSGTFNLNKSTVNNNIAATQGGGIFNGNAISTIINSTISNNTATQGGGIYSDSGNGPLTINYSTISNNTASSRGGGIARGGGDIISISNSIIADNYGNAATNSAPDFFGILTSRGYNLIENTNGTTVTGVTTGNILGQNPQLLPLGNYGGSTQTIALQPTSPAVDAGEPSNFPPIDQRGIARPQDGDLNGTALTDIGAYERQVTSFTVTKTPDTNDGVCNADCSLREAITAVNSAATPDNEITFSPTFFNTVRTLTLTLGELQISNNGTLIIKGTGANLLTISGNNQSRIFFIKPKSNVTIGGLKITGGNGVGAENSGYGGAVSNSGGTLLIIDSVIIGNTAFNGGGIANTGLLTITTSTINNNSAPTDNGGGISNGGTLTITNSTISGNSCGILGGGIANFDGGTITLTNSTVAGNSAGSANGSGGITSFGTVMARNSIIADNTVLAGSTPDFRGTLISQGYNLIENTNGTNVTGTGTGNIFGQDPKLAPLANNGGLTQTQALLSGSPAIDAADPKNFPMTDQRGFSRPRDGDGNGTVRADIGAFEVRAIIANNSSDNGVGSLRQAIIDASTSGDAIVFNASSFNTPQTIILTSGDLIIPGSASFTIDGKSADKLTISGNNQSRVFSINTGANVAINGVTITGGNGTGSINNGHDGAISNFGSLTLSNSIVSGNSANGNGGGIGNYLNGTLTIINSTIRNNSTATIAGGGIFNQNSQATVISSTINNNSAAGIGGGIANISGRLTLINTTVSGNSAGNGGGGISNFTAASVLTINNSTIISNLTNNNNGGGINNQTGGIVNARNTIIANNTANNASEMDFSGPLLSQGYNIIKNTTGTTISGTTTGNLLNIDPLLDPQLRDNGGATLTHALRLNSPAIDSGGASTGITADQRGFIRPFDFPSIPNATGGNGSDIGAFERQSTDVSRNTLFDFDGDGKSDVSVYRPSNGVWYLLNSNTGFSAIQFGISTDKIVPADYDGDGKTDVAVWRDGTWYLQRSTEGFAGIQFGSSGDIPVPSDFNGDGRAELAVFRPSNGTWYVLNLVNNQFSSVQFGLAEDRPVVADYDGDGRADYAVYRPSNGTWYLLQSTKGFSAVQFGISTDKPVVGDYDGDGKADEAVYRQGNGTWYLFQSTKGFAAIQFGLSTDLPTPADFDGDSKTDVAVFRSESGIWYQLKSVQGFGAVQFGSNGDKPTPNAFVP